MFSLCLKLYYEFSFVVAAAGVFCVVLAALHRPHCTGQTVRLEAMKRTSQEDRLVFVGEVGSPRVAAVTRVVIRQLYSVLLLLRVCKRLRLRPTVLVVL